MRALVLEQLRKAYGGVTVVDRLDLTIAAGELVSLLGPSGCGKTTTLRMIAGFVTPDGGTIMLDGKALSSTRGVVPPEKRGMAMIFQSYAVWPHLTVFENVAFGLRARRLPSAEIRKRVGEILDVVRLGQLAGRFPAELSGGQQQRIALARSIVTRPDVLLLDEPLSNLDTALRGDMRKEIRRLHDEFQITMVYVTHDLAEAMAVSDRIAVMSGGRIEQIADPATLFRRPRTRFVAAFIGGTNVMTARRAGDILRFADFEIAAMASNVALADGETAPFSLRAKAMTLHATAPSRGILLPCRVLSRTYAGDSFEYDLACPAGASLRVDAAPGCEILAGAQAWVSFDPADLVQLEPDCVEGA